MTDTARRLGHVPGLDGIRGIAIALVVLVHAFGWPRGGFVGVDLFFVLSGFLITTLLLNEYDETAGQVAVGSFWMRRARRLLPALFTMLAVYTAVDLIAGGDPAAPVLEGAFYVTNLVAAFTASPVTPLSHLWSLAEEEQFYLFWPLILCVLLAASRHRRRLLVGALLLAIALVNVRRAATIGFYSPDTRSDGLMIGCLLSVIRIERPALVGLVCRRAMPVVVPLIAVVALIGTDAYTWFRDLFSLVNVLFALLVGAAAADAGGRVLAAFPLRPLGGISYSLYLWQTPVMYAFGTGNLRGHFDVPRSLLAIAVSVAIAALSTRYVERPFRRRRQPRERAPVGAMVPDAEAAQA